ncbi:MAG TPA: hypothetical protein PK771_04005 [Spirochaetota bacterium]|nr:hypothetical protein [Spirochaetota bacterium]
MDKKKYIATGICLIIIGATFLIANFIEGFDWRLLWPIFLVIPIIFLTLEYFTSPDAKKNTLFSIFFLLQLLIFFFIWTTGFHYKYMEKMWTFFIIMPGVALFPLYLVKKEIKLIFISLILIIIGTIFSLFTIGPFDINILNKIWPVFLVIGGLFTIIFYSKIKK